jgi:hypothetical protein
VVKETLAETVEAGRVLTAARAESAAAKAAIAQAEEVDRAADTAAVAAGKPLPDGKAGPKARKAAEVADRRLTAADSNYTAAVERLTAVVGSNAGDWLKVLHKQRETTRAELTRSLAAFTRARAMLQALDGTIAMADDFVDGHDARLEGFPTSQQIEQGAAEPDRIRDEVLKAIRGSRRFGVNESDVDRVIVELELIAAGERPWAPSINLGGAKEGPPASDGERAIAALLGGE